MNLCVIPARGGSKRIPRKNIKPFAGKPMIAYAISAAKTSGLFEHVIVTTDDQEIAEIAHDWGAEAPFLRPPELSDDHTPTVPVVAHAITVCKSLGWQIDFVCCIYPCVPFIHNADLKASLELLKTSGANYSFPVTEFPSAIQRGLKRGSKGQIVPFYPEYETTRTQDLEVAYYDAGQFYWGAANAWLDRNTRLHTDSVALVIPQWRVVDIDTNDDWLRAELIGRALRGELSEK
jgi:pseudaminic acid cytidylyltransferase